MKLLTKLAIAILRRDPCKFNAISKVVGDEYSFLAVPIDTEWCAEWPGGVVRGIYAHNALIVMDASHDPPRTILGAYRHHSDEVAEST